MLEQAVLAQAKQNVCTTLHKLHKWTLVCWSCREFSVELMTFSPCLAIWKRVNRDLLQDFIRANKRQLCLWCIKSKDYYDKAKRDAAYDILLKKYKLIDPKTDKEAVVKKINAFRTNYRKKRKKLKNLITLIVVQMRSMCPHFGTSWIFQVFVTPSSREKSLCCCYSCDVTSSLIIISCFLIKGVTSDKRFK
jgi:hypothetical protein